MNKGMRKVIIGFVVIFLAGCAPWQVITAKNSKWSAGGFSGDLPAGWAKFNSPTAILMATRDGLALQYFSLSKSKINQELPNVKKKIQEDMLLQEVAGLVVDDMSLDKDRMLNFALLSNKPDKLGGVDAFRLEYTFNDQDAVLYQGIKYGFVKEKKYYELDFVAARQHYFDSTAREFEGFVQSFRVK